MDVNLPNPLAALPTPTEAGAFVWNVLEIIPFVGDVMEIIELIVPDELVQSAERSAVTSLPGPRELAPPLPHEVLASVPPPPSPPDLPGFDVVPEPIEVIDSAMQAVNLFLTGGMMQGGE